MKKLSRHLLLIAVSIFFFAIQANAQQTLAEKLGYAADTKLLIVHADDIGLAQSVNDASNKAFASGGITSGSIMVPCPWFVDFAEHYKSHPDQISDLVLAKRTKNIDLIIGGHTHTFLKKPTVTKNIDDKNMLVNQVGCWGVNMGRIDFIFDESKNISSKGTSIIV